MEAIYAVDNKNGIAKNGIIPWYSKKDLNFFKNKTQNNVVIMGKNTFFSLPNGFLNKRLNIVLTKNTSEAIFKTINRNFVLVTNTITICDSLLQDKEKWKKKFPYLIDNFTIFVIGGKQIYEYFIPICDKIWVTEIKNNFNCDLFLNYDYSEKYSREIIEEDDELRIVKYQKILFFTPLDI